MRTAVIVIVTLSLAVHSIVWPSEYVIDERTKYAKCIMDLSVCLP